MEDAVTNATTELTINDPAISIQGGWVAFEFSALSIIEAFKGFFSTEIPALDAMTAEDFNRIYDPDAIVKSETDEKIMSEITRIITSVILSVTIENNGAPIANFILDALESNDMFYDSAAMVLKDKENWTEEKLVKWSTMAGYSSLTDYNCIHRFSNFKVTGKDSEMNDII